MRHFIVLILIAAVSLGIACSASAGINGNVLGLELKKSTVQVGEKVEYTVKGYVATGLSCDFKVLLGDGRPVSGAVAHQFPYTPPPYARPYYTKPGKYTIKVWGNTNSVNAPCGGQASTVVTVVDKLKPGIGGMHVKKKIRIAGPVKPICPPGWKVKPGSISDGGFTCIAKKPVQKIKCPPNTEYFENECAIGCKPVPR